MLSALKINESNWLVQQEHEQFLVTGISSSNSYLNLSVAKVDEDYDDLDDLTDEDDASIIPIAQEVWSARIFCVDPGRTLYTLVHQLSQCIDLNYPVELVYLWGGQVCHTEIRIVSRRKEELQ